MIPLKSTHPTKKFPKAVLVWVAFIFLLDTVSRYFPKKDWILKVAIRQDGLRWENLFAPFVYPHFFSLLVGMFFIWAFMPRFVERRGIIYCLIVGLSGFVLSHYLFFLIHPQNQSPILCPEAFLGACLGAHMRREIWASTETVVLGMGLFQVYNVPSYVLLFFWLFYLLIGNLFLVDVFRDAPMLYLFPLISFLWGFLVESIWGAILDYRNSTTRTQS